MSDELVCWRCGAALSDVVLPLGRRAECPACHADLHVCRLCRHYDTGKARQCREPVAEPVQDKSRANFCDWFQPRPAAWVPPAGTRGVSRPALDALFGSETSPTPSAADTPKKRLDDLFG